MKNSNSQRVGVILYPTALLFGGYDIDTILFDKNYYLVPEPGAEKAYEVLRQSLLSKKAVAVAKTVLGTNEELMVLYPLKACIIAKVLFYQEEIQEMPKS